MKKILAALLIVGSSISPAMAHGYGNGWVPFAGGALFGYIVSQPRPAYVIQQQPVYVQQQPQTIYVYPQSAPLVTVPQMGQHCELRSEMVNGQIVQGNFCYQR
jgi:hypothetical protein